MPDSEKMNDFEKRKANRKKVRIQTKMCYKCGEPVKDTDEQCPHCGASAAKSSYSWLYRVVLGVFLGFLAWAIFWR